MLVTLMIERSSDMKHFSDMIFPPVEEDDGKSNLILGGFCGVIGYSSVFNRC
uniref:Uncharacterized protein n=1 Tax=Helianthus annuus TaxID=4232 RepID=A0A251SBZ3_HELAN